MRLVLATTITILGLLLSACGTPHEQSTLATHTTIDRESATPTVPSSRTRVPKEPVDEKSQTATITRVPAPEQLIGKTLVDITSLFGNPIFVRRDPPGEFWRYRSKGCVLELYFYERDGAWRVAHMEMRRSERSKRHQSSCIAFLRSRPRKNS